MSINSIVVNRSLTTSHSLTVGHTGTASVDYTPLTLTRDGVDANQVVHFRDLSLSRVNAVQSSLSCRYNPTTQKTYYRIVLNDAIAQASATDPRRENVADIKITLRDDASTVYKLRCVNNAIQLLANLASDIRDGLSPA